MAKAILATETERKFLVREGWPSREPGRLIRQGYLPAPPGVTLRVRWTAEQGTITVKTPIMNGSRWEAQYPIEPAQAEAMLAQCPRPPVEKCRRIRFEGGVRWEIDEFLGRHVGLLLAEVELTDPRQSFPLPDWVGCEVTGRNCFRNSVIVGTESAAEVLALWQASESALRWKGGMSAADVFPALDVPGRLRRLTRDGGVPHRRNPL